MPRDISAPMLSSLISNTIRPAFMSQITFRSAIEYIWTGVGNLIYGGNTFRGVGSLGKLGTIMEGTEVRADGTSVTLSAIDPALLSESLTDIQIGAPAEVWLALFDESANILGAPYSLFVGTVDQPVLNVGTEEMSITLKLENKLANLQRASNRRYTAADQNLYYPGDTGLNWVELMNDIALKWS
jgi:hypothetical protein